LLKSFSNIETLRSQPVCYECAVEVPSVRAAAESFDEGSVPVVVATTAVIRSTVLDARARWMLAFIDGETTLGRVLPSGGLPIDDAREAISELVLRGIVVLRASSRGKPWIRRAM
jgi:hypothetical protein